MHPRQVTWLTHAIPAVPTARRAAARTVRVGGGRSDGRAEWLEMPARQRHFLRLTTRVLTDEQAGLRTTASELCLGGLIRHDAAVERNWVAFILNGPSAIGGVHEWCAPSRPTNRSAQDVGSAGIGRSWAA